MTRVSRVRMELLRLLDIQHAGAQTAIDKAYHELTKGYSTRGKTLLAQMLSEDIPFGIGAEKAACPLFIHPCFEQFYVFHYGFVLKHFQSFRLQLLNFQKSKRQT